MINNLKKQYIYMRLTFSYRFILYERLRKSSPDKTSYSYNSCFSGSLIVPVALAYKRVLLIPAGLR